MYEFFPILKFWGNLVTWFFPVFFHGFNEVCYIGIRFFGIENSVRDRVIPVNRECYKSRMDIFPAFNCDHEVLGLFTLVKYLNIVKLRSICNVNLWMLQNLGADRSDGIGIALFYHHKCFSIEIFDAQAFF